MTPGIPMATTASSLLQLPTGHKEAGHKEVPPPHPAKHLLDSTVLKTFCSSLS